jgi:hypothetical protein
MERVKFWLCDVITVRLCSFRSPALSWAGPVGIVVHAERSEAGTATEAQARRPRRAVLRRPPRVPVKGKA